MANRFMKSNVATQCAIIASGVGGEARAGYYEEAHELGAGSGHNRNQQISGLEPPSQGRAETVRALDALTLDIDSRVLEGMQGNAAEIVDAALQAALNKRRNKIG